MMSSSARYVERASSSIRSACRLESASSSSGSSARRSRANSRMVSSIQYRSLPSLPVRRRSEALVEQRRERLELGVAHLLGAARGCSRRERPPRLANSRLLVTLEQVVRPGDRRAERGMTRVGVARRGEVEAGREPLEQRFGGEEPRASRRELEREREPVEPLADPRNDRRRLELLTNRSGAGEEESDRLVEGQRRQVESGLARRPAAPRGSSRAAGARRLPRPARRAGRRLPAAAARRCRAPRAFASRRARAAIASGDALSAPSASATA